MCKLRVQALLVVVPFAVTLALILAVPQRGDAIPPFSRQYGTSCSTCHLDFPKLNDFGKAFKDAGFKFPKDDESMIKIPPVMLGAPAQKDLWPHAIWPGTIPGLPPIGLRMNNYFQVTGNNRNNFQFVPTSTSTTFTPTAPTLIPRTDFETGFFSIFTAGNFGSDIAFWVDDDISVAGSNSGGGLGDGYLKFVNLGRLWHMPADSFSLRVGQFELDLPFTQARSIDISPYDIYTQANVGVMNSLFAQQNVNNVFTFAGAGKGVEISGGHHYGGYWYSLAAVDQNTTGTASGSDFVPSATGGNNGGVGFVSDANFKDLYGNFMYRFNLERNKESRDAIQAAGPMGPRDHTYLSLGAYYFYGRAVQRMVGVLPTNAAINTLLTAREPFYRTGPYFSFNYRTFNVYGLYMYGRDHNLVPVDATGTPFPAAPVLPVSFIHGVPATFGGGFVQADYLIYPWTMLIMRYDAVNSQADFINGLAGITGTPFFGPVRATRNRFTPGVQFLIHANIKASFEYQVRAQQHITAGINPITGLPVVIPPFRTNTATVGLEFVY